jgi:hypothetical protein
MGARRGDRTGRVVRPRGGRPGHGTGAGDHVHRSGGRRDGVAGGGGAGHPGGRCRGSGRAGDGWPATGNRAVAAGRGPGRRSPPPAGAHHPRRLPKPAGRRPSVGGHPSGGGRGRRWAPPGGCGGGGSGPLGTRRLQRRSRGLAHPGDTGHRPAAGRGRGGGAGGRRHPPRCRGEHGVRRRLARRDGGGVDRPVGRVLRQSRRRGCARARVAGRQSGGSGGRPAGSPTHARFVLVPGRALRGGP